jgi:hypothetical protein
MNYDFYPAARTMDLRDELHNVLHGDFNDVGIGRHLLIRRITDRMCVCFDAGSGSPNAGCSRCLGEGFLWTETLDFGYIGKNLGSVLSGATAIPNQNQTASWGTSDENRALAYLEYTAFPNYERYLRPDHPTYDKLFELKVDEDGELVRPIVRVAKWKIRSLTPHQGDNGRIEFFELGLDKETL